MTKRLWVKVVAWVSIFIAFVVAVALIDGVIIDTKVPVSLPFFFVSNIEDAGLVQAQGSWTIEGGSDYYPLQTSTIRCDKRRKECITAQGYVSPGSTPLLNVDIDVSPVIEWTDNHLVYTNTSSKCMNYVYTLDWATKSGTGKRTKKPNMVSNDDCKKFDNELRLTLKDGFKIWRDETKKAEPKILKIILDVVFFSFRD